MAAIIQRAFAGGEIGPPLYARCDEVKYATGLRTLRNFILMKHGGITNRPGTIFIGEVSDSSKPIRSIPFEFDESQVYVLEIGNHYCRFIQGESYLTEPTKMVTAATQANPGVLTVTAHGYSNGDEVQVIGILGMTQLNGRNFKVGTTTTNTFQLQNMDGTPLDTTSYSAYISGGTVARVYQIFVPYVTQDLPLIKFFQSADVVTITHPKYPVSSISRLGALSWSYSENLFAPVIPAPSSLTASVGAGGGTPATYVATAIDATTSEESLISNSASSGNAPTATNPVTVAWTASPNAKGYNVYKLVGGTGGAYGFIGTSTGVSFIDIGATADTSQGPPLARNPFAPQSGTAITGVTNAIPGVVTSGGHGLSTGDIVFISGLVGPTVLNGLYFQVGSITTNTFTLLDRDNLPIDTTGSGAYVSGGLAQKANNFPSCGNYIQQRQTLANQFTNTEVVYMSKSGQFKNFTTSLPSQANDSITFNMAGRKVSAVKHIVDVGKMVVFASTGEWTINGDGNGVITPSSINPQQTSYYGSNDLRPITIGNNAVYIQARGSIVRDFSFKWQTQGYAGDDLTIFSPHLFENFTIVDWDYQQTPNSVIWAVRNDGVLLGLTYIKEQEIWGWHRHDFTNGFVENVCCVPNTTEDDVYLTIRRTINGQTKRYIEKLDTRVISDIKKSIFMDSTLSYDGTNLDSDDTMTLTGSGWTYHDQLTITSIDNDFTAADIGNEIQLTGPDGTLIRFKMNALLSATQMTGFPDKTVPVSMQAVPLDTWTRAIHNLTGLWHLEGQVVSIVGDAFVVASPNNSQYVEQYTVTNGAITLPKNYGVIHVGLPYISDMETLDIDTPNAPTISTYFKKVDCVSAYIQNSRGFWAGMMDPEKDPINKTIPATPIDPLKNLYESKIRNFEPMEDPIALNTEVQDISIATNWNDNGRVFIRNVDPIPLTILSVVAAGEIPVRQ